MKAVLLHTPKPIDQRPLVFADAPDPSPGPNEILVRVTVCGVCHTDLHEVEGELPMLRSPVIPGHQVVGTVAVLGESATGFRVGERVGIAWLHDTCGVCEFCLRDSENLCGTARFTGWSVHGGYAEYVTVPEAFAYRIPERFPDEQAAPLLCAGIIGHRALRISGIQPGQRLGLYGFGASAHIAIQVARHWGCQVYVVTRSEANREFARKLGAVWVGGSGDTPPAKLHASVIFAPAGTLVREALEVLEKGGRLALASIYMTPVPPLDYLKHLYHEKVIQSVANATRRDGRELLDLAGRIPIHTATQVFPLQQANEALLALKTGRVSGAIVLRVAG
jgi:propanol-preferring alcohol dehydrogenase